MSLLELPNLQDRPALFSTFLMWLLADLFHDLPEVGDVDKPKLVFFFDEAHLLFADASKAFLDRDRADRAADPVQGRRHLLRHADAEGRTRRRARPAGLAGAAPAAGAHAERREGAEADGGDLPEVALRPGARRCSSSASARRSSRSWIPDGAPTPVAWTRMRAPQSLMAPTPEESLRPASPVVADGQVRPGDRPGLRAGDARRASSRRGAAAEQEQQRRRRPSRRTRTPRRPPAAGRRSA